MDRKKHVCPDCERKECRMKRYKAERNNQKLDVQRLEKLLANYSTVEGRSDTEQENISLRSDLTEALKKIEKLGQEYTDLSERHEINDKENKLICKKNKELKNVLRENKKLKNVIKEKVSEVKRLEGRYQHLQIEENHVRTLMKEKKQLRKQVTYILQTVPKLMEDYQQLKTENKLQRQNNNTLNCRLEILNDEKEEIEDRLRRYTTTDQEAKDDIKQLQTAIQDLKEENKEYILQGKKFKEEKTELEKKLRLHDNEVTLLYNSLDTERHQHDAAMKRLEMKYTAVQNECVELWLKLQNIHNSSEISFEKFGSVIDKNIFKEKLEETRAQGNMLAKETTKILKNFASAKDKKVCIKVLKKRFEKSLPTCDNGISSDENTDIEDINNASDGSCKKYYQETLMESRATTPCHNRMSRTTNVFNVNIASSKVLFNENTEEQFACIDGSNGQYSAIDE